jgi:hypothetical protein
MLSVRQALCLDTVDAARCQQAAQRQGGRPREAFLGNGTYVEHGFAVLIDHSEHAAAIRACDLAERSARKFEKPKTHRNHCRGCRQGGVFRMLMIRPDILPGEKA